MKGQTLKLWKVSTMLMALSAFLMCLSSVSQTMAQESGENYTIDLPGKKTLDMVWIEAGTFKMGSPEEELGRNSDEVQHEVKISKGFWMGKTEVTQGQWNAVMGSNKSTYGGNNNLPVTNVTWEKAMGFCKELTKMEKEAGNLPEGYKYTLPTEAQWEYACRAGTRTSLNSGENITAEVGECPNLDKVGWYGKPRSGTPHPVGKKQPNEWGLYDMHGNVWEWCLDWYGDYPKSTVTDPKGPSSASPDVSELSLQLSRELGRDVLRGRVLRGGSYYSTARNCRSAYRNDSNPNQGRSRGRFKFQIPFRRDDVDDRVFRVCLSYTHDHGMIIRVVAYTEEGKSTEEMFRGRECIIPIKSQFSNKEKLQLKAVEVVFEDGYREIYSAVFLERSDPAELGVVSIKWQKNNAEEPDYLIIKDLKSFSNVRDLEIDEEARIIESRSSN
jgi:formylglycine-generating enzyme required for sulfatase activity